MIDNFLNPDWHRLEALTGGRAQRSDDVLRIDTSAGSFELSVYAPGVFRVRGGRRDLPDYDLIQAPTRVPVEMSVGAEQASIGTAGSTLTAEFSSVLNLSLHRANDQQPLLQSSSDGHFVRTHRLPPFCYRDGQWFGAFELLPGEQVYGLGEKWGALDKRGQLIRSFAEDALGVNAEISYKNTPFLWSPRGWGVVFNTPATVHHAVGFAQWSNRSYGFLLEDAALDLFILAADQPADLLQRYAALTGMPPAVPRWSLGVWMSRAYYRTAEELLAAAREIRDRRLPCDVITLDGRAWLDTDTRFAFEWDASRYPDPRAVTDELHSLNYKVCVWEYPLVSERHPLHARLAANGWLLKNAAGDPYRYQWDPAPFGETLTPLPPSGIVDFTHPEADAFWAEQHNALFDAGVDVIKSDFGEQVPADAIAHNGDHGGRLHNVYPLLYNRCVFRATEARFGCGFVFARSGWLGSQRYPAQWGGDPQADWGGLAGTLNGALSSALSGNPWYASDIGGFYGDTRDAELYVRWAQLAVFASHMRFHGIGPREPWSYDQQAAAVVQTFVELRYRLLPLLERALAQASACGLPLMRPMVLACPDDPAGWAFEQQFMFGDDLLVAPVLRPGGRGRYYLPAGEWVNFFNAERRRGPQVIDEVVALEQIPLYVRSGATIELAPVVQHTGELDSANLALEAIEF